MKAFLATTLILLLTLAAGCQTRWIKLDGSGVEDADLEKARQACRVDRKLTALARAEDEADENLAKASSNEAKMLVREEFDAVRKQVWAEIDTCMRRQGYFRQG